MQKLAEICVRRPVFAAVLILVLVVIGAFGFTHLGVDRFPQVENPTVSVSVSYPGSPPEAVETEITQKIEENVNTIAGVDELRSTSKEGSANVTVQFDLSQDPEVATQNVRDKVAQAARSLPQDLDTPIVRKQDPDSSPIIGVAISGPDSVKAISTYADEVLTPQIETAEGVGDVILAGGRLRQINVLPDPFKLRAYGLSINDVVTAVQKQNLEVPGGDVENGPETLTLRTQGRITSLAEFSKIIVKTRQISAASPAGSDSTTTNANSGGFVRLSDVATVQDGEQTATTSAQLNGKTTVLLYVRKQSGVNTLATIESVKERLEKAKATLPAGYSLQIVRDQSQYIDAAVHAVEEHLVIGSILAVLVVLVFLLNWRATIISAISIPASIIATFGLMWAFGYTLNIITLLALTLAIGIVIDDAIVVIENIFRVMNERDLSAFEAAIEGTREIGLAVLATTLSLVAVFAPVAFMSGLTGRLLSSFGLTMSFAIMVSLLVSFTLAPSLGARWLGNKKANGDGKSSHAETPKFFQYIEHVYVRLLDWSLQRRWVIMVICFAALASVPTLYSMAPFNFLPDDDESQFQVGALAAPGTSLEETTRIGNKISQTLRKVPGVDYTLLTINGFGGGAATNNANIFVGLKSVEKRSQTQNEIMAKVRKSLPRQFAADNLRISVSPLAALPGFGGGSGGRGVQYVLSGPDLAVLQEAAGKLLQAARKMPGVADADSNFVAAQPELQAKVDRDLAGDLGVNISDASQALNYVTGGQQISTYNEGGQQYEVWVRAPAEYRSNGQGLSLYTTASSAGTPVNLDQIVKFKRGLGPTTIQRLNRQRQIQLQINTAPTASAGTILAQLDQEFKKLNLPASYTGGASGSSKEQNNAASAFFLALSLSVVFMYLILAAQFESWIYPITILVSLPLTIPFALLSVVLFGQSLNIYSALGILLLFGVVKKNAILQVDHTNQLRARGLDRHTAMLEANRDRLRPILMTTIAFVAGMLPLVVSSGTGAGTNRAIGTVVFGGQTLSLLLTLVATPVIYSLLDDAMNWWAKVRGNSNQPVVNTTANAPLPERPL
ncbi:multidrug resistance protein MdtC [Abditibacteriota bacterium]|nr:multidrug resistance protein MdtC [Abditibacteriota bacterium]